MRRVSGEELCDGGSGFRQCLTSSFKSNYIWMRMFGRTYWEWEGDSMNSSSNSVQYQDTPTNIYIARRY